MACAKFPLAASAERFQLCGKEVWRGNNSDFMSANQDSMRGRQRGTVPAITESEDGRIDWHEIQKEISIHPAANRRAFRAGFAKAELPQPLFEGSKFNVRCGFDNYIHIKRCAGRGCSRIGY